MIQFCTVNLVAGCQKILVVRRFCNICDFFLDRTFQLNKFMGIYVEKILFVLVQSNILLSLESRNEAVSGSPLLLLSLLANRKLVQIYLVRNCTWIDDRFSYLPNHSCRICLQSVQVRKKFNSFRWLLSYSVCIVFRYTCLFLREWETTYSPFIFRIDKTLRLLKPFWVSRYWYSWATAGVTKITKGI